MRVTKKLPSDFLKATSTISTSLLVTLLFVNSSAIAQSDGGFLETPLTAVARPTLSKSQIQEFMPERGLFKFPAPYNTQAIRLTNATDCAGNDCVNYAGYSYWRNMNNHVGMESMLIFVGLDRSRGGAGPSLLELNKTSGELRNLGPLLPDENPLSWATGEGWYFSATMPTKLYINDGPRIARLDVITGQIQTVVDITQELGAGYMLRQLHSSDDDRVHSATVRDASTYKNLGCMAFEEDTARYHFFPIAADFDECQVDRSGDWLLIKANLDGVYGEDNLIVDLRTGEQRTLLDQNGAAGHSDLGHGYMIAADNWANDANTWKLWDFNQPDLIGSRVYHNSDWHVSAPNHVSHTNAKAGQSATEQFGCGSSVNRDLGVHGNEIFCFGLDGSESTLVVAPVMTDLSTSGGGDYALAAKGNLDVTGRYYLWTSNMGGSRLDAFIVRVPGELLTGVNIPTEPLPPIPSPVSPPEIEEEVTATFDWHATRNVTVSGDRITKTSGCDGCADAGVVSMQRLDSGPATLEFTVQSTGPLMFVGFTGSQAIPKASSLLLSLRFQSGVAEVREGDVYKADTEFQAGDSFSISIVGRKVQYARNGVVFHTSKRRITYPLYAGGALYNLDSVLEGVVLLNN